MCHRMVVLLIAALAAILICEPAFARKKRRSYDRRVDNGWQSGWCPIADEALRFTADSTSAQLRFEVNDFTSPGNLGQGIDNIFVMKESTYDLNRSFDFFQCVRGRTTDFPNLPTQLVERFDFEANGWQLKNARLASGSSPRLPFSLSDTDSSGLSVFIDPGGSAALQVNGLEIGVNYVVDFWWSAPVVDTNSAASPKVSLEVDTLEPTRMFLSGQRFELQATFSDFQGNFDDARAVALTEDSGFFYFFGPDNVEVLVKILDGCALNGNFWVFVSGLTNVLVDLQITDTYTDLTWSTNNPLGNSFQPIFDVEALPSCLERGAAFDIEPNDAPIDAQDLEVEEWVRDFGPNIGDRTSNTSLSIPHIKIRGRGDGSKDVFAFVVPNNGDRGIFDVDNGADGGGFVDTQIRIINVFGDVLAENDDADQSWGQGGSEGPLGFLDSYIEHVFFDSGLYFLEIASAGGGSVPAGADYRVHVSIENHP